MYSDDRRSRQMEEKQKQTEERNDNAETVIEVTDLCKVYKRSFPEKTI